MGSPERRNPQHWIVAGVIALMGLAVALFAHRASATFAPMYADFGGELPWPTALMFTWWVPPCAGVITACPAIVAIVRPPARWIAFSVGAALALAIGAASLWATYLPIYELAGAIR